jgi:hypothetical protein
MPYFGLEETESDYLISSRREKCRLLIDKEDWSEEDLIEFYIAIHVVLEVGLNALLRRLAIWDAGPGFDRREVIKQVDGVFFKDKMAMFLYHSQFDFSAREGEAQDHHNILKKIIHFSEIRNQLLHGHSISTFDIEGQKQDSAARKKMNQETFAQQINLFKDIVTGVQFYLDCLVTDRKELNKQELKDKYLDLDFLNNTQLD